MKNLKPIPQMFVPVPEDKLLQEHFLGNKWAFLVGCILLNRTHLRQVNEVSIDLFRRFSTPLKMKHADPKEIYEIIKGLGFGNRRSNTLKRFSSDWLEWDGFDPRAMFGIGEYAYHSYLIFYKGTDSVAFEKVKDKELIKYLEKCLI